mgnify:CR=1 FL=1
MTYTDSQILAKLKAEADDAWMHSGRLAKLANAGLRSPEEFQEALRKAQEATKRYQAFAEVEAQSCQN